MGHRGQGQPDSAPDLRARLARGTKKNDAPLLNALENLCAKAGQSCDRRNAARLTEHVLAQLACLGTHTVTGVLSTCGHQFRDWSADYRLYGRDRVVPELLFEPVRQWLCDNQQGPVVVAMDDTCLRKTGRKVHGVKYMRDPLGPPFRVNFMRAQRFVQTSMACRGHDGRARMIPVDWVHAPVPAKPGPDAGGEELKKHRAARVSAVGAQRMGHLRGWLDAHGAQERTLWTVVDGSYTNGTVLKALPKNTTLVGRIRADAKLHHLPLRQPDKGRRLVYGEQAPTPEQLRQDETVPWQHVNVFFGGKTRELRVKQLTPVRWRTAGRQHTLQVLAVAPTPYRLSKNAKMLYRQPAYLVCTDPEAAPAQIVQHYLWRWDIEVNHRDEKTILGVGDAQVRTPKAVQNVTGCAVAAYAMLLVAAARCHKENLDYDKLPAPKWRRTTSYRPTTMNLVQNLRHELWGRSIHFSGFEVTNGNNNKPQKGTFSPYSALFYSARYS